ncbi:hypothetical protein D0Y65_030746 [Glycine soja]|uniref:Uncharacterized protein n=1 Tax=Glycine soja TaxID=3848 RepID=A0A445I548_GLYSO|nr:hypothetical protein D0Y65_030746 [Glycine soja]
MAIGVPISINDVTLKYTFGHFARLLIVINLSKNLHQQILVQREGYAFSIKEPSYEALGVPYVPSQAPPTQEQIIVGEIQNNSIYMKVNDIALEHQNLALDFNPLLSFTQPIIASPFVLSLVAPSRHDSPYFVANSQPSQISNGPASNINPSSPL